MDYRDGIQIEDQMPFKKITGRGNEQHRPRNKNIISKHTKETKMHMHLKRLTEKENNVRILIYARHQEFLTAGS